MTAARNSGAADEEAARARHDLLNVMAEADLARLPTFKTPCFLELVRTAHVLVGTLQLREESMGDR
jgi:hypothetical protein